MQQSPCLAKRSTSINVYMENNYSCWSNISFDILSSVAERLPYLDLFRFGAVCRSWRACVIRGIQSPAIIRYCSYEQKYALELADLLHMQFHCIGNMNILQGHQLFGCRLHASKHGWLLFSKPQQEQPASTTTKHAPKPQQEQRSTRTFFFYNPLGKTMELPSLNMDMFDNDEDVKVSAIFSTSPTCHDCVIFVILYRSTDGRRCSTSKHCFISTCKLSDKRWITREYPRPQDHEIGGLAYVDGVVHCVFYLGSSSITFATFHVALKDWVMIDYSPFSKLRVFFPWKCYLVESGRELLFAFYGLDNSFDKDKEILYWHIYQFDRSRKDWTRVLTLGNRALLIYGVSSSIIMSVAEGKTREIADKVVSFDYDWMHCTTYPSRIDKNKCQLLRPRFVSRKEINSFVFTIRREN